MLKSMRSRVTATAVVATGLALTLAAVALHVVVGQSLLNEIDTTLLNRAHDIVDEIEITDELDNASFPSDPTTFVGVLDIDDDQVVLATHNDDQPEVDEIASLINDPQLDDPGPIDFDTPSNASLPSLDLVEGDTNLRFVAVPVPSGLEIVVVARSLDELDRTVSRVDLFSLISVPLLTALVGLLVWMLIGRALQPVENMRAEVEAISASALDRRVGATGQSTEIDRLGETMNSMLVRLEESRERERRFASDAAHELRSPLASIAAQLDVDQAHPSEVDQARTAQTLRSETNRLQGLVDDLLLVARSEQADSSTYRLLDLDDVLAVAASSVSSDAGVRVTLPPQSAIDVRANEGELQRLITNLLSNAVRHATSTVEVTTNSTVSGIEVAVHDDGAGIAAADRSRIFERFTRLDEARSRDQGGSGLGLALVQEIAHRHGGSMSVEDSHLGGATFTLTLPPP